MHGNHLQKNPVLYSLSSLKLQSSKVLPGKNLLTLKGIILSANSFSAISSAVIFFRSSRSRSMKRGEPLMIWLALRPKILAFSYLVKIGNVILSSLFCIIISLSASITSNCPILVNSSSSSENSRYESESGLSPKSSKPPSRGSLTMGTTSEESSDRASSWLSMAEPSDGSAVNEL